jgi:hypothetical protein
MDIRLGGIPPDSTGYQENAKKRAKRAKPGASEQPAESTESIEDCYIPSTKPEDGAAE